MGGNSSKRVETPQQQKRLFECDPRSPTEGITRTPIMVDVTPMQAAPTPSSKLTQLLDPRSPGETFKRSPMASAIKFDFSELEQALQDQLQLNKSPATPKANVEAAPTPPSTPLKARGRNTSTPLSMRSPNVNMENRIMVRESDAKHTPAPKSRLRHVAHQNQAKKRGVVQDENSPRPIRL